jgi:predicted anti-sigma-YlaC factor YlaD
MNMKTTTNTMNCRACKAVFPDLLLDPSLVTANEGVYGHLRACAECRSEYEGLRATFALMDEWTAPEPTPYFDTRLHARLRAEIEAKPESLWERMRSYLMFSTGRQFRPIMAGALGVALLAGGGTLAGFHSTLFGSSKPAAASATVNDLKILDNNAQAEQQLNQLLDSSDQDQSQPPTT